MYPSPDDFDQPLTPPDRARARDRGLRRSRRLTRWIAVAAVTGAAALGGLYTHLLPGSSASPVPSSTPHQNPAASSAVAPKSSNGVDHGGTARHEDDDSDGDLGEDDAGAGPASQPAPQPPAQPPAPTQQPPHTTTGAS
ncbi:hypothetical protein [Streptomyces sp. NPDC002588]|uniref:hypothetical protein n=1 Tax=Streptomyces sp. NPDC002588 TaxID=3154419 RepID=UPI00331C5463